MIMIGELARRLLHREAEQQPNAAQLAAQDDDGEEDEQDDCPHNEDDRINAARMGAPQAWICRACGYRGGGA